MRPETEIQRAGKVCHGDGEFRPFVGGKILGRDGGRDSAVVIINRESERSCFVRAVTANRESDIFITFERFCGDIEREARGVCPCNVRFEFEERTARFVFIFYVGRVIKTFLAGYGIIAFS